ncbi:MAG TPA: hypothetical protein VIF62_16780 [Labilithrix sp.]
MSSISRRAATPFVLLLLSAAACTTSAPDGSPAPTDPQVFDASDATKQALGIAKWGYAIDDANASTVFHGYGAQNELRVEIRQTLASDAVDTSTKHFALTVAGAAASASERIDFVAQWSADGQNVDYAHTVLENTFVAGGTAALVLDRLAIDTTAMTTTSGGTVQTGGLFQNSANVAPRDEGAPSSEPAMCCLNQSNDAASQAALGAQSCAGVTSTNDPLIPQAEEGGGDIHPDELVIGPGGVRTVKSPWAGPYNIVDHHCHNAAASNSSKTDGYIACVPESSSTMTAGHTINWAPDPRANGAPGRYCAYEPQWNGGRVSDGAICCWHGAAGADGAPLFASAGAKLCVTKMCLKQAYSKDAAGNPTQPKAYPAGSTPPVPNDCPGSTSSLAACNTCCTTQADNVTNLFVTPDPNSANGMEFKKEVDDYRKRCATGCTDRDLTRPPPTPPPPPKQNASYMCLARSYLSRLLGSNTVSSCGAKPPTMSIIPPATPSDPASDPPSDPSSDPSSTVDGGASSIITGAGGTPENTAPVNAAAEKSTLSPTDCGDKTDGWWCLATPGWMVYCSNKSIQSGCGCKACAVQGVQAPCTSDIKVCTSE